MRGWFRTLACCGVLAAAMPAQAASDFSMLPLTVMDHGGGHYGFTHGGWSGGGIVTGTFTGFDNDNNGQLNSFVNEITDFSVTFSGSANAPAFSLGYQDFYGLIYTLESGLLGETDVESPGHALEGIWAFGVSGLHVAGPAVLEACSGTINCGIISATVGPAPLLSPTALPEPASWTLLIAGLGATGSAMRRRRGYRAA